MKKNVVWIIVDSVRRYYSPDDRSRLKVMDSLAQSSVEFENCITSAPSTVMSISAMMTSLPSYFIGRNYTDFRFDNDFFTTLSSILNGNGYTTRALIMHKEIREKLRVFDLVPKKYWPKGYSHLDWWDNSKIYDLLKNTLEIDGHKSPKPCFWFLDFNCRKDPKTSDIVADSIELLESHGYTKDNTVYILCSDHGYPDPARGITPEALKKNNMTHDIFMTDDNIMIPMILSYPGCPKGLKIKETVSSLDLMPTILDILDIGVDSKVSSQFHGKSLFPLINGEDDTYSKERKVRVDARFLGQKGRVTAIRSSKFKYVLHHDSSEEEFIDVQNIQGINEINIVENLNPNQAEALEDFRAAFAASEKDALNHQIKYALYKLKPQMSFTSKTQNPRILVLSYSNSGFLSSLLPAIKDLSCGLAVDLLQVNGEERSKITAADTIFDLDLNSAENLSGNIPQGKYDLALIAYDSSSLSTYNILKKIAQKINTKKTAAIDLNMNVSINTGQLYRYLKTLMLNKDFYLQEPRLIVHEMKRFLTIGIKKLKSAFLRQPKMAVKWK